jgi:hypothetical protein
MSIGLNKHYYSLKELIMKMKFCIVTISLVTLLSSCEKDKVEDKCMLTTDKLAGTYKLTEVKYKLSATLPEQDFLSLMEACEKDDLLILNSNGTYNYTDIGITCTPPGTITGTWSLNGNNLQSDGILEGEISSFDCNKVVYFIQNTNVQGDKLTFTMTKQ